MHQPRSSAREKLLDSALSVIRQKGYSATTVDDLCHAAGVTKGGFFHHFKSKEDLAVAAADHFSRIADSIFVDAPYRALPDPVDRVLGYVAFRRSILQGELCQFTCLVGTMVQEAYETHPAIRQACNKSITEHAAMVEQDIAEAMQQAGIASDFTPSSLAFHTQAVIQGAFILAKSKGGPEIAAECLDHLIRYLKMLFHVTERRETNQ